MTGTTPVIDTNRTDGPTVANRAPANLKKNSATLTGRLVDAGLGTLYTGIGQTDYNPSEVSGLRLWLDASDIDANGIKGPADPPTQIPWSLANLNPILWLDANHSSAAGGTWTDRSASGNDATRNGGPYLTDRGLQRSSGNDLRWGQRALPQLQPNQRHPYRILGGQPQPGNLQLPARPYREL